jgi:hypothetical protein
MKISSLFVAGLAIAILSIAPANAEKNKISKNNSDCAPSTCQGKFKPASYAECMALGNKRAWDTNTAWLYCSNQGYKN